ncbi:hypothetical protein ACIBG8_33325 [Nonomuraea sp. NPDC050556]|uniref:hypothetical protein n=1 Tax=Nonomuraea sp. NPDC050556 TaxID=3364369 RepID=UPI0037962211
MRRLLVLLALCTTVTACDTGKACTLIGADPGIVVESATKVTELEVCWSGSCRTAKVTSGFARVEGLPENPVEVRVAGRKVTVTPKPVYPNGKDCGGLGPQAKVVVEQDGSVHERP